MHSFAADPPKVLFEEKFTDRLDPGWKWIRERPDAWRLANGALIEDTLPGSYWEKQNSSQNTLVRPAPVSKEGFIVEVFLESEPKGGYEHAGLLCYFDGYNTLILNKESIGGKGYLLMVAEQDGKPRRDGPHNSEYAERGVWLRMIVRDGKVTSKFRSSKKSRGSPSARSPSPSPAKNSSSASTPATARKSPSATRASAISAFWRGASEFYARMLNSGESSYLNFRTFQRRGRRSFSR